MKTRKIALLGGSFNPITKGHIDIAQYVLKNSDIKEVWLSPCSGHLQKKLTIDDVDRLEMCNVATTGVSNIYVSVYEIEQKLDGSAYTFIKEIKKLWGDNIDFHYIIGMDNVHIFNTWRKSEELKSLVKFIVVPRVGVKTSEDLWYQKEPHKFLNVGNGVMESSSTKVRELLKKWWKNPEFAEKDLYKLIDTYVLNYIVTKGLYK